ncbi:MAG: DNA polymerase III subunit delta [Betaproteobacteria bacterium]|nr:DNA polymerase III subunit delta [Betaproteobacteria bacterium]
MALTAEQFLAKPPDRLAPLYGVHGAESLGALEVADAIRAAARAAGFAEREVFTAEPGCDWGDLTAASSALSLFATQRLLEIRIPSGKPGREGSAVLEAFCTHPPADTVTLVTLPEIDWQGQKSKWFAALGAAGTLIEARPIERARLPAWLAARLARQGQSATPEALEALADRVEGNLLAAKQEIDKLGLLCPPGELSLEAIEHGVADVARFDAQDVLDAIHAADASRVQRVLAGLKAEGEALPFLLWLVANELRLLARMVNATSVGRFPHPQKARALERLARRHSPRAVLGLLAQAAAVDRLVKGIGLRDPWEALADLGGAMAGTPLMPAAPELR